MNDYWRECVIDALNEAGLTATDEQIETMAEHIELSIDNYDLYSGNDVSSQNRVSTLQDEIDIARRQLKEERDKINCEACAGRGTVSATSLSRCWKCNGEGRYKP